MSSQTGWCTLKQINCQHMIVHPMLIFDHLKRPYSRPQKTFLLGVGAQKAGTTWLYDYLSCRKDSVMGYTKEYHVFDSLTLEGFDHFTKRAIADLALIETDKTKHLKKQNIQRFLSFMDNPAEYYDYFAQLLKTSDALITADFSPLYSALSVATLAEIKSQFSHRGIRLFPIFLMREPVDRLRSMIKMQCRSSDIVLDRKQELEGMYRRCGTRAEQWRSNYHHTYENLTAVFGEDKFISFYETIFQASEIKRLCRQLKIKYLEPNFDHRVNVSTSPHSFSESDVSELRAHYQVQYDFAEKTFGKDFIDTIWRQSYRDNFKSDQCS